MQLHRRANDATISEPRQGRRERTDRIHATEHGQARQLTRPIQMFYLASPTVPDFEFAGENFKSRAGGSCAISIWLRSIKRAGEPAMNYVTTAFAAIGALGVVSCREK